VPNSDFDEKDASRAPEALQAERFFRPFVAVGSVKAQAFIALSLRGPKATLQFGRKWSATLSYIG